MRCPSAVAARTSPKIDHVHYPLDSNVSRKESIGFGNKRFVFKARSPGFRLEIGNVEVGFHTIHITAKLQRKQRFLGIESWGPPGPGSTSSPSTSSAAS